MDHPNNVQRAKSEDLATDRQHLEKLCALNPREKLRNTRYSFVAEDLLESLSCVQLDDIDVDIDRNDSADAATYFQPSQFIDDGLKKTLTQHAWSLGGPGQARRLYPEHKAGWFAGPWAEADELEGDKLEIDRFGGSAWRCMEYV